MVTISSDIPIKGIEIELTEFKKEIVPSYTLYGITDTVYTTFANIHNLECNSTKFLPESLVKIEDNEKISNWINELKMLHDLWLLHCIDQSNKYFFDENGSIYGERTRNVFNNMVYYHNDVLFDKEPNFYALACAMVIGYISMDQLSVFSSFSNNEEYIGEKKSYVLNGLSSLIAYCDYYLSYRDKTISREVHRESVVLSINLLYAANDAFDLIELIKADAKIGSSEELLPITTSQFAKYLMLCGRFTDKLLIMDTENYIKSGSLISIIGGILQVDWLTTINKGQWAVIVDVYLTPELVESVSYYDATIIIDHFRVMAQCSTLVSKGYIKKYGIGYFGDAVLRYKPVYNSTVNNTVFVSRANGIKRYLEGVTAMSRTDQKRMDKVHKKLSFIITLYVNIFQVHALRLDTVFYDAGSIMNSINTGNRYREYTVDFFNREIAAVNSVLTEEGVFTDEVVVSGKELPEPTVNAPDKFTIFPSIDMRNGVKSVFVNKGLPNISANVYFSSMVESIRKFPLRPSIVIFTALLSYELEHTEFIRLKALDLSGMLPDEFGGWCSEESAMAFCKIALSFLSSEYKMDVIKPSIMPKEMTSNTFKIRNTNGIRSLVDLKDGLASSYSRTIANLQKVYDRNYTVVYSYWIYLIVGIYNVSLDEFLLEMNPIVIPKDLNHDRELTNITYKIKWRFNPHCITPLMDLMTTITDETGKEVIKIDNIFKDHVKSLIDSMNSHEVLGNIGYDFNNIIKSNEPVKRGESAYPLRDLDRLLLMKGGKSILQERFDFSKQEKTYLNDLDRDTDLVTIFFGDESEVQLNRVNKSPSLMTKCRLFYGNINSDFVGYFVALVPNMVWSVDAYELVKKSGALNTITDILVYIIGYKVDEVPSVGDDRSASTTVEESKKLLQNMAGDDLKYVDELERIRLKPVYIQLAEKPKTKEPILSIMIWLIDLITIEVTPCNEFIKYIGTSIYDYIDMVNSDSSE